MNPWFAAATGFVIAASLWIYSPHPQLTFPAIAIGKVPCQQPGCGSDLDQQGSGQLTINSGQPLSRGHKPAGVAGAGADGQTRDAARGLTFGYLVRPAKHGNFNVLVTVTGKRAIKNWRLAFVLPGDQIRFVIGAHFEAAGSDGGVASPLTGEWRGGPGDQGVGHGDHGNGLRGGEGQFLVGFTVVASGKPPAPTHCRYDGAVCTFHQLTGH